MIAFVDPYHPPRRRARINYLSQFPVGVPLPITPLEIFDGDTLNAMCQGKHLTIRLRSIDAPEKTQPYGPQATDALRYHIAQGGIQAAVHTLDQYGRYIADLFDSSGLRIQDKLVDEGAVWVYIQYAAHEFKLLELQTVARSLHKGLWQQPDPVPPWIYRHEGEHPPTSPESLVFHSLTGYAFHLEGCSRLRYPVFKCTKAQAESVGRTPCGVCRP